MFSPMSLADVFGCTGGYVSSALASVSSVIGNGCMPRADFGDARAIGLRKTHKWSRHRTPHVDETLGLGVTSKRDLRLARFCVFCGSCRFVGADVGLFGGGLRSPALTNRPHMNRIRVHAPLELARADWALERSTGS